MRVCGHIEIDHGIGDAVAHLIGVTFRNRLAGEEIISPFRHVTLYDPTVDKRDRSRAGVLTRRGVAVKPPLSP
jgi:hypothetical protein